jgi:Cys-tRNA(Pro) deacylase
MTRVEYPITNAVRFLRERRIAFQPHFYAYEDRGGTKVGAAALDLPEHAVVKTLVMETDQHEVILVLMHGDREVSAKQLARVLGVKSVSLCDERTASRHTGYVFGGTSPFGTRSALAVHVEKSIFQLPRIFINGGKRGLLVEIDPCALRGCLPVIEVEVAI